MSFIKRKIILASKSPRRSQLLRDAGIEFEILTKEVEEDFPADMPVREVATYLAKVKAEACADYITEDEILLTADSTVVLGDQIFNKPLSREDACQMLRALSGVMHTVYTGVCLLSKEKEIVLTGVSNVYFDPLTDAEIDFYVDRYRPYDKAGSYAVQEWIGLCKISRIEGTYSNIMGLPVDLVYKALLHWDD